MKKEYISALCILTSGVITSQLVSCNSESNNSPCLGDLCTDTPVDGKPDDLRGALQLVIDWLPATWTGTASDGNSYDQITSYVPVCPYAGETLSVSFDSFSELDCGDDTCDNAQSGMFTFLTHVQLGTEHITLNGAGNIVEPNVWQMQLGESTPNTEEVRSMYMRPDNTDDTYYSPESNIGNWYLVMESVDTSVNTLDVCLIQFAVKK